MNDKPKKLVLDYSKWRCGYSSEVNCPNQLGVGEVRLLNDKGFMCCIGQFSQQLGVIESKLIDKAYPCYLDMSVAPFNKISTFGGYEDSRLTAELITINDDAATTPDEKIKLLTEALEKEGIELEVINKPD